MGHKNETLLVLTWSLKATVVSRIVKDTESLSAALSRSTAKETSDVPQRNSIGIIVLKTWNAGFLWICDEQR